MRSKEKVLLVGAAGFVGQNLLLGLMKSCYNVVSCTRTGAAIGDHPSIALDLQNPCAIAATIKEHRPDLIINSAGLISIRECERCERLAWTLNACAVGEIADAAISARVGLVSQISTDAVFGGNAGQLFTEEDVPEPSNTYGSSKRAGETNLIDSGAPYQVIRTSAVIGDSPYPNGRWTFQRCLLRALELGNQFEAMTDAVNSPTYIEDVVHGIIWLMESVLGDSSQTGIYHLAGQQPMSKYELAKVVATQHGYCKDLVVPTVRAHIDPHYPPNTSLNVSKMNRQGFITQKIQ